MSPETCRTPPRRVALLVVTSDPAYRDYFGKARDDLCVEVAATGGRALDALFERRPDVLLLDLAGCEIPGADLLRAAKHVRRSIAAIVVSATPSIERDARLLEQGVFFYTAKPPDPSALEAALAAAHAAVSDRADRAAAEERIARRT